MLEEVDVGLEVLAVGGGGDGLLVVEVVLVVPELDGEVFEDGA